MAVSVKLYVLPQDMGAQEQPDGQWRFVQGQPLLPAPGAERAPRCAVVVLSGADASTAGTDAWLTLPGVLALAQDTQTCFDPAGARAAIDTGAHAVPPERIGETLASWANLGVRP